MMFGTPCEDYEVDPLAERALDLLFILHADHEQNAVDRRPCARRAVPAPTLCLHRGRHRFAVGTGARRRQRGRARHARTDRHVGNIDKYLEKAKDKDDPFRLMGFGHRVYKNYDPRAKIIREVCHQVLKSWRNNNPLFELAMRLEEIAAKDEYFVEKKLYPNVDFYSGIIYRALGIPDNMFTVMFAIARTAGWVSHWMEMLDDPKHRIGRPRQLYQGASLRDYVPLGER
jgi:citrate synthase